MSIAVLGTARLINYEWLVDRIETLLMPGTFVGEAADGTFMRQRPGVRVAHSGRRPSMKAIDCRKIITGDCKRGVDWYVSKFAHAAMLPLTVVRRDKRVTRYEMARRLIVGANLVLLFEDDDVSESLEAIKQASDEFKTPIIIMNMLTEAAVYVRCEPIVFGTEIVRGEEPQFAGFVADSISGLPATLACYCVVRFESRDHYVEHRLRNFELLHAQWDSLLPKEWALVGALKRLSGVDLDTYAYYNNDHLRVYNFEACDVIDEK